MSDLAALAAEAATCTRCRLAEGRTHVVFGMGDPGADLLFLGEGPGADEDAAGLPFVGRSGKLLDRMMAEEMGLTRAHCYIANMVKCLRYNAPVLLGDGSWERIGRLVGSRYDGRVKSVDSSGRLVSHSVVGWHASPLAGRRVFKLSYRSAKRAGAGKVGVELTGDHQVLSEEGYVPVQEMQPGSRIATGQGMSEVAEDVVVGTLLGDGHLNSASAFLSFAHTLRYADYAYFKAGLLSELHPSASRFQVAAVAGGEHTHAIIGVRTLAARSLGIIRSDFYAPKKQVPSWLASGLSARILAFWFMDDGHLRAREGRQPRAEIATCSFSERDLSILHSGLLRLGLDVKVLRGRLHFGIQATASLSELIAPYVPPVMRYKLVSSVEKRIAFNPERLRIGPPRVFYEVAEIEETTERRRSDVSFYCIDVEQTHNFVTAGGVVHNCRPPGNRDPRPDEMATCRPWLDAQLAHVDPKVVVTLGNVATRTLLGRREGIGQLRGRSYPWEGRMVIPTYHPSAALRGTDGAMAGMRADLVRAKLALSGQIPAGESPAGQVPPGESPAGEAADTAGEPV